MKISLWKINFNFLVVAQPFRPFSPEKEIVKCRLNWHLDAFFKVMDGQPFSTVWKNEKITLIEKLIRENNLMALAMCSLIEMSNGQF